MRVLDIDLDFFLDGIANWKTSTRRLEPDLFKPWKESEVEKFLTDKCGITGRRRIPGRLVAFHHEAFAFWRELIDAKRLVPPFEVIHIDAHSDLGMGDPGWMYLMGELLHQPIGSRSNPPVGHEHLNEGNYLSFAIACRWISKLVFVTHPDYRGDLMPYHFKNFSMSTNLIELKCCNPLKWDIESVDETTYKSMAVVAREPTVPLLMIPLQEFRDNGQYDFINVSHSPAFTPTSADLLLKVFRKRIAET